MKSTSPVKNIIRNKLRYIILFVLYLPLIVGVLTSANIISMIYSYSQKTLEKYGGTLDIHFLDSATGVDIKKALEKLDYKKYLKEVYYPAVETNSRTLNDKLIIEYVKDNQILKDEYDTEKIPWIGISLIGLDTSLLEYSGEKFELIEGRMFEGDGECIINREENPELIVSSLNIGDKVIFRGSGEDIELTVTGIVKAEPPYYGGELFTYSAGPLLYTTKETILQLATQYRQEIPDDLDPKMNPWYEEDNPLSVVRFKGVNNRGYGYKCVGILKDLSLYGEFQEYLLSETKDSGNTLFASYFYNFEEGVFSITSQILRSSLIFLCIIIAMLIITTVVTSIMYLSNRKYEFAVLCSVGMSKPKIMGSYIVETLTFTFFTTLVAAAIGQPIFAFGLSGKVKSAFAGWIDTALPITDILLSNSAAVLAGMVLIVAITVIISLIYMFSFEPLKIYNKRYS